MDEQQRIERYTATCIDPADVTVWYCGDADVAYARVMDDGAVELSAPDRACWYIRQGRAEDDRA